MIIRATEMKSKSKKQFQHGIEESVPTWNQNCLFSIRFPYWGGSPKTAWGIGWGDHFLPHKFIKRSTEHWATSTKQLLNAGRGHQAARKAALFLGKKVGQNIKGIKRDKRVRDGDPSRGGNREEGEVAKHQNTLSPAGLCGVLESQRAT